MQPFGTQEDAAKYLARLYPRAQRQSETGCKIVIRTVYRYKQKTCIRGEKIIMEEKILDLLAEICESEEVKEDLDQELFASGALDSIGFAEFLVELEEKFGIVIAPSEVERSQIDTPQKILELIRQRQ